MNDFEKQLKKAAGEQSPPPLERRIWLGVKDQLSAHQRRRFRVRRIQWSAAASILLLIVATYFFNAPGQNTEQLVLQQYGLDDYGFPQKVEKKLTALTGTKIPKDQVENFNALKSQLYFLDQQYQNYLEYIDENGYQEYIGKQIQSYYEVKIELLEKIQKEIQKLKSKKNENNNNNTEEVDWQI